MNLPASTILSVAIVVSSTALLLGEEVDYARDIKPILQGRCYPCHGALKQESSLRLDTVKLMLEGGDSGPAIAPGKPEDSLMLQRVMETDVANRMPPEHEGEPFTAAQIAMLRKWIAGGAPAPEDEVPEADPSQHWAFQPRVRPEVPAVENATWVRNAIDAFIAQAHQQHGLVPQAEADRAGLVRRLYLDLLGLPPSPEELARIEADQAPDWYERLVNTLLDDPRYGQRWARHWMDVWRYSDWWGLGDQLRNSQKHIWHWRDWIVESLNEDMPYDEMIRLMLAGDELYPNDLDKLRATGYLARNYVLFNRNQWMDQTVEHVGKGFLGLTMNCAKCHDHKFDPITHADYYAMRAFFEPYHVRLDAMPGQADLAADAIPRPFDGQLDTPTYLFTRGDETNPDKSQAIAPGVPSLLTESPLRIEPVKLPIDAWQPERRPWVIEAHLVTAAKKLESAEQALRAAEEKLAAAPSKAQPAADVKLRDRDAPTQASELEIAEAELEAAQLALTAAQAEQQSVQRRAAAMQATWAKEDAMPGAEKPDAASIAGLEKVEREAARAAALAEREAALALAKHAVAAAKLRTLIERPKKRAAAEKDLQAAQERLDKVLKQPGEAGEAYTRLVGAAWTATRFLNSTKDDPEVTFPPISSGRRTALAQWIASPNNPLTARVAANQIWLRHMGTPLVATVFDFGRKGTPPTHPELLEWLACELVDSGWSMKHLHRLIATSSVYRLGSSAAGAEANLARDPDNAYWWRRTPIRIEAEVVRDSILSLAGTLDERAGGPPVLPAEQAASTRRSLYFFHSNNDRNLFLTTFDEAMVEDCYRREQNIIPQQALALTNSRLVLEAAPQIAERLSRAADSTADAKLDDAAFVRQAFQALLGMTPNDAELSACLASLAAWREQASKGSEGKVQDPRANLIWALLNHNDFVTLR